MVLVPDHSINMWRCHRNERKDERLRELHTQQLMDQELGPSSFQDLIYRLAVLDKLPSCMIPVGYVVYTFVRVSASGKTMKCFHKDA